MTFNRPPGRGTALPATLLVALALAAASCAAPAPTPTIPPSPTVPPTAAPTAAPTRIPTARPTAAPGTMPALQPAGARTGIAQLDAIVDAFLASKLDARRPLIRFLTTPCTTAQGLGGPPKCAASEANGTPVEVFPEATTEGTFFRRNEIDRTLEFTITGLYGVYRVPTTVFRADYWPAGEYAVVFAEAVEPTRSVTSVIQTILYVQDGAVVRLRRTPFPEPWPPAEAAGATWVLAPVK